MYPEYCIWLRRKWTLYRGIPRLISKCGLPIFLGVSALGWMGAVADPASTGIPIPPDPKISVPQFESEAQADTERRADEADSLLRPVVVGAPVPEPAIMFENGKKKAGRKSPLAADKTTSKLMGVIPTDKLPFEIGERLEIDLGWMALTAGRAVIEVRKGELIHDRPTLWLWGNVLSSRIVDAIYHVDNTIESFVDTGGFIPYKFLLHMVESPQLKETRVAFDHPNKKAFYWAKRVSTKYGDEVQDRADDLIPSARDMFSALYYARTLEYSLNQKQSFTIYENGKNWEVELLPVANELVISKVGAFQCWKILVRVKLANVLSPTGDIYMWLSDDSKKYLLKFDAKVKIGSLWGNLTSIRAKQ